MITLGDFAILQMTIQGLLVIYLMFYFKVILKNKKINNIETILVINSKQEKFNTSNYILSNILPIITLEISTDVYKYIFIILIAFLGVLYVNNNLHYINPLLDICGIKVYKAMVKIGDSEKEREKIILSEQTIYNFDNNYIKGVVQGDIIRAFQT